MTYDWVVGKGGRVLGVFEGIFDVIWGNSCAGSWSWALKMGICVFDLFRLC